MTERGHPRRERHGARATSGQGRTGAPGGDDGVPHQRAAQGLGQIGGVATGEIDQAGALHLRGNRCVLGVVAIVDVQSHGLHAKALGLRSTQVVPALNHGRSVGHRRRRQLHVSWRATGDEAAFNLGHLGQILTRTDQGQGARALIFAHCIPSSHDSRTSQRRTVRQSVHCLIRFTIMASPSNLAHPNHVGRPRASGFLFGALHQRRRVRIRRRARSGLERSRGSAS